MTEQENTYKQTNKQTSSLTVSLTFSAPALPILHENQQGSLPETGEPEQGQKTQLSRGGGLRDPPGFHPCPGPAQFLRETTVRKTHSLSTTGLQSLPFQGHEVTKTRLVSCPSRHLSSPRQSCAQPCWAEGRRLASMLFWAAHLLLSLQLVYCWAFSCQRTESSPGFSLPGDFLLAGLFSLHGDCLQVRHRPLVTSCDR